MVTISSIIDGILNREGRTYTNVPGDNGGPTKFGITLSTLQAYRRQIHPSTNGSVTSTDVQNLTEVEAREIYEHNYIKGPGYDKLGNLGLIEELIDAGVNHGVQTAIRMLQRAVKVKQTGIIDLATITAVQKLAEVKVVILFLGARAHYYASILTPQSEHNWKFAAGWFNRLGFMIEAYGNEL